MAFNQYANLAPPPPPPMQSSAAPMAMGGQQAGNGQDFFRMNPEMINFGLSAGQDMINKQRERIMPGVSGFWVSLKIYFAVSNGYVLDKLKLILYPVSNKQWARKASDETYSPDGENSAASRKWALPREDLNAPDLYIPLMAFMTYILLYGLYKGLGISHLSPNLLIEAVWRCLAVQAIECTLIKLGASTLGATLPFLDVFAYTGYKYVGLCVSVSPRVFFVFGYTLNTLVSLYTSLMLGWFFIKTLAAVVPPQQGIQTSGPPRHLVLLGFAALEVIVSLFLIWL